MSPNIDHHAPDESPGPPLPQLIPKKPSLFKPVWLIGSCLVLVLIGTAGFAVAYVASLQHTKPSASANSRSHDYYLPPLGVQSQYKYEFSGTIELTSPAGRREFVTHFEGPQEFELKQPFHASDIDCLGKDKDKLNGLCDKPIQFPNGRTGYPYKEPQSGVYVKVADDSYVLIEGLDLRQATETAALDDLVDRLAPVSAAKLHEYDQAQRHTPDWQQRHAIPGVVYAPQITPNHLGLKAQTFNFGGQLYGGQYLGSYYDNKQKYSDSDNTASTYSFDIDQVQRPADFNPVNHCVIGQKKFTCVEVTSGAGAASVDTTKYHLYLDTSFGVAASHAMVADFGGTVMVISMFGPLGTSTQDLESALITSLNSMVPTAPSQLPLLSVAMVSNP